MELHNNQIEDYLNAVEKEIKWKPARPAVREELFSHIREALASQVEQGPEAVARTIAQMGDPAETGRRFNAAHRPPMDWWMLSSSALLLLCGFLLRLDLASFGSRSSAFGALFLGAAICAFCTLVCLRFPIRAFLIRFAWPLFGLCFGYILLYSLAGIYLPFQLAIGIPHIVLLGILSVTALLFRAQSQPPKAWRISLGRRKDAPAFTKGIPPFLCGAALFLCLFFIPSASNALALTAGLLAAGLFLSKTKAGRWWVIGIFLFCAALLGLILLSAPYRFARFTSDYSRFDPYSISNIIQQELLPSSLWGVAYHPGKLMQIAKFYPYLHFMLTFGILPGVGVFLCSGLLLWRVMRWSLRVQDRLSRSLCAGITTFFSMQMVCGMLSNLGLFPELFYSFIPFLEASGSTMVLSGLCVALLLGFGRYGRETPLPSPIPLNTNANP